MDTPGLGSSTVDQVLMQVHQVPQIYTKYKYWSSTHFLKKYLSTSSTFISSTSTSTSTHIKICSTVRMDIQSRVNLGWTKHKARLSPNHVFAQKSRWPYFMQSKFGINKIQGSYKLKWLYGYMASGYIFTSSKKVTDYL